MLVSNGLGHQLQKKNNASLRPATPDASQHTTTIVSNDMPMGVVERTREGGGRQWGHKLHANSDGEKIQNFMVTWAEDLELALENCFQSLTRNPKQA